jgi:hypothetical protein
MSSAHYDNVELFGELHGSSILQLRISGLCVLPP